VAPGAVSIDTTFNAKAGTSTFTPASLTCSNVSCHGGQTTPDWEAASSNPINVLNACLDCHSSGTTQYNSYHSGSHNIHISRFGLSASTCRICHDSEKVNVSGHFSNLATHAFEQAASATILSQLRYEGGGCNPRSGGLFFGCHGREKW
jgi:predicted CxxxxCH...CXXCH cytochrome family protein